MAPSPFTLSRTARSWPSAEVTTVRLTGQLDEEAWPAFTRCLEEARAVSAGPYIAVELGPDAQLSDTAARWLVRLVLDGGRSDGPGRLQPLVLTGAWSAAGEDGARPPGQGAAAELRDLRANLRTRPLIAQTQGILQERYGLSDADAAFDLLRVSSQRHNVKLRTLASVFLSAPRPAEHSPQWFPGRTRAPAPPLAFAPGLRRSRVPRSAFAEAVLQAGLRCVHGESGLLHVVDPLIGLQYEAQQGIPDALLDHLTRAPDGADRGPATDALRAGARIALVDGLADERLDEATRRALGAAGIDRAWYVPLPSLSGEGAGVLTVYGAAGGAEPTDIEWKALDLLLAQAGEWLDWHRRTVVLDALEYLHARARVAAGQARG
ncbi:hypothetical protein STTU_0312 [Streptomyces sp. Tu6071]|uniref:ANTAR domain-containing protein n=1 Tax=unclassified Streptomyces TaxID=2593676 RepID=UPI00020E51FA|nr:MULTISPECIES: ANTAR domain-containing protein [unclassified Streptomyces]EGJ73101.1 hypothetical protein STTU_0312 [Streptomyces sp. Tu6071]SCE18625.1 ANTAR domain-containing protein [Streptomyces sp. SolWspMP-sol7th]